MKPEEKHIIWSNYDLDYDDWKDDLEADYPDLSEQERIALMYEINGDYLDDERMNLNVQLSAPILVIGDLGLWNGRRMGYKEIASGKISDCLYSDTDYATWYGRFFKLYLYTAIAPIPLSSFAGEPSQNVGKSFIKSYAAVCLEGAIIVLACIIFSLFAASPPTVDPNAAAVSMVWSYIGELVFNMLVLVGAVKMADRVVREMMGL